MMAGRTSLRGVSLRPLGPDDEREVVALWQACAGDLYPLRARLWRQITADNPNFQPSDVVIAVADPGERGPGSPSRLGPIVGFGYLGRSRGLVRGRRGWVHEGWLQLVAVTPGRQREGIGRAIVERLVDEARGEGLERVTVGGGTSYLFPGVPVDLLGAQPFFEALGARFEEKVYDVRADLDGRATGDRERAALAEAGLVVRRMDAMEDEALLALIDREFGLDWVYDMGWAMDHGMAPDDVLLLLPADAPGGPVASDTMLGFAMLHERGDRPLFGPRFWEGLLDPPSGGLGPIGVVGRLRGRGMGRALLAAGLDTLHARGVRDCVVDWTTLLDFYGAFGFQPWKAYIQGDLPL
jgi:predicted N-acetyltransferase YhbS